jgi:phytoene desaturase
VKISIIGSGFSSLSNACYLAKAGHDVTVYEKNEGLGGRARVFSDNDFVFDAGPSWYWMPDVFENFFNDFGKSAADYYQLTRLDPSYQVIWKDGNDFIPAKMEELKAYFENYEPGSGEKLDQFLAEAEMKYNVGMGDFVTKPSLSIKEFLSLDTAKKGMSIDLFKPISKHIRQFFKHPKLIELLEFPVLFLGAKPKNTPALYSLMNYADMALGTWYPMGGMHEIVKAFVALGKELGVAYVTNANVESVQINNGVATGILVNGEYIESDVVVSGADYHHTDQTLLEDKYRNYTPKYWDNRTMAPSSLLYYIGLDRKIDQLKHHNLFFDRDFNKHAEEIYDTHKWPQDPLFYACVPSKTDKSVAPEGMENIFILIPVSTRIEDSEAIKQRYFNMVADRLKAFTGVDIRNHIKVYHTFANSDFKSVYNSYRGNAYGLANTLKQTAFLKPKCKNKHVNNLYYTGQLTVPGPGVPPSIISGKIVADLIQKEHKTNESLIRSSIH